MITNHLVKVGRKTYISTAKGKTYNIVDQFLSSYKGNGKLVVLDNGFPTIKLLEDAKTLWNTRAVATEKGKTAHFSFCHQKFMKQAKHFSRGISKSLHHGAITITYWNDNNPVCFIDNARDNDIETSKETWETIEVKNRKGEEIGVHLPKAASYYRSVYGWVDRFN